MQLAQKLDVHRATIYRDIDELSRAGLPIWQADGAVGILTDRYLLPLRLNIYEALSLFIATRLLGRMSGERDPHIESLLTKLADILPSPISEHLMRSAQSISMKPDNPTYVKHLEMLVWAWVNRRRLRIRYRSAQQEKSRERLFDVYFIEPLETVYSCYVIGWDYLHDEVRTLKIKRIQQIEETDELYNIREDVDIFARWATTWGIVITENTPPTLVTLRFNKNVAYMVKETVWHPTQSIEDTEDGGCIFSATVNHVSGIKLWIRSWGPDVEVLGPEALRVEVAREALNLHTLYQSNAQASSEGVSTDAHAPAYATRHHRITHPIS
jgi:predicted DNA-binding transcriptional regulator YafY